MDLDSRFFVDQRQFCACGKRASVYVGNSPAKCGACFNSGADPRSREREAVRNAATVSVSAGD